MVDCDSENPRKALAERLKHEAEVTRPAFSEALHARICRAVGQCELRELPQPSAPLLRRPWVWSAIAVTLLLGALLLVWKTRVPTGPTPEPIGVARRTEREPEPAEEAELPTDVIVDVPVDVGVLVDSTLANRRWAYLDHDARLAAQVLIAQLPLDMTSPTEEP